MVSLSGAEYRLLRVFLDHPQRVGKSLLVGCI
jgi:DNA-binding response OmpR family regulator